MDYAETKIFYLHNQIETMRSDMQNYIDMVTTNKSTKK